MMNELKSLGLSYYESKALEIILKERLTVRELCKRAKIPLGKVYSIIRSLREKNLVIETESRPKEVYVQNASNILSKLIDQKQREHEYLLSNIRYFASEIDQMKKQPSKFFELGTTIEDNKNIQLRSFKEAQKEICQVLNIHHKPESNRPSKTLWENEIKKAIDRGITFRCIYPRNIELPKLLRKLPKNKFNVKRLNTDFTRCDIIDKKKVLIKLVHKDAVIYGGIIFVENEKFARNLQNIFEQLWDQAED